MLSSPIPVKEEQMSRSRTASAEVLLAGFAGYLREQRGVSALTVDAYVADVRRFLACRGDAGSLHELSAAEVSKVVLHEVAGRSPASVRRYGCALRAFLRYCRLAGLIGTDLSAAVLPVAGRRRSLLPQGLTEAQALALLRVCDRRRAAGRRDYAVIVLMRRLGLRAGEVAALRLEDIDWRAGQVTVHGKRARVDQLPLPTDVGKAIAGYLQRGRPRTAARQVFVRTVPPPVGLSRSAVPAIVRRACARAGLAPFGAHRLRHTTACNMLRAGGSRRPASSSAPMPAGAASRDARPRLKCSSCVTFGGWLRRRRWRRWPRRAGLPAPRRSSPPQRWWNTAARRPMPR
jgi:integrase/recombinase XerD